MDALLKFIIGFIAGALTAKAIIYLQTMWIVKRTMKRTDRSIEKEWEKILGGKDGKQKTRSK